MKRLKSSKKRSSKITLAKVQKEFNAYVRRRDDDCLIKDHKTCCKGDLNASHFFPVGGNSGLRFYPFNCFGQCAGHHISHHQRNPLFYVEWMQEKYPEELEWMESVRGKSVRYNQDVLKTIFSLCREGDTEGLKSFIRSLF